MVPTMRVVTLHTLKLPIAIAQSLSRIKFDPMNTTIFTDLQYTTTFPSKPQAWIGLGAMGFSIAFRLCKKRSLVHTILTIYSVDPAVFKRFVGGFVE